MFFSKNNDLIRNTIQKFLETNDVIICTKYIIMQLFEV